MTRFTILIYLVLLMTMILALPGFRHVTPVPGHYPFSCPTQSSVRILIILQKTAFKSELTRILLEHYTAESIDIEVADFNTMPIVKPQDWNAIIILQSWEDWQPQPEIISLIKRADQKNNILVVTTSDTGQEKLEGIDAISSASRVDNAQDTANKIIARLEKILLR